MKKNILVKSLLIIIVQFFCACSNPLGGEPAADSAYQPGALTDPETPSVPVPVTHPAPTITGVTPTAGVTSGGEIIHISGTGFRSGVVVKVGGTDCATVTLQSPTLVDCQVPATTGISLAIVSVENADHKIAQLTDAWSYIGLPKAWLRADAITGLSSGDLVATWIDSSANANDFVQSNPANQPRWISNELNGLPVVRFPGGPMMESSFNIGISGSSDRSIFFVAKKASNSSKSIFGWGNNSPDSIFDFMNYSGRMMSHFYVHDCYSVSPNFVANVWSLHGSDADSTGVRVSIDGVNSSKYSIVLTTGDSKARIGGGTYTPYDGYDGDIAEAIILPQKLTGSEQSIVTCYLSRKYNLNLPTCP